MLSTFSKNFMSIASEFLNWIVGQIDPAPADRGFINSPDGISLIVSFDHMYVSSANNTI